MPHSPHSHVALAQGLVDRQQAGDLLDDDFPGQLDGLSAAVSALPLGLEPTGFLTETTSQRRRGRRRRWQKWWRRTRGRRRREAAGRRGQRTTGLKVAVVEKTSH